MTARRSRAAQLRGIKILLMDVDGVLTDGGVYYGESGEEQKKFNVQDGYGLVQLQRAGVAAGIITGRVSRIVARRAEELGIREVHQNLERKLGTYEEIIARLRLRDTEVAYIGDDEPDLEVLRRVGFSAAPADAAPSVRAAVDYVCSRPGGAGAVREVIDLILKHRANV